MNYLRANAFRVRIICVVMTCTCIYFMPFAHADSLDAYLNVWREGTVKDDFTDETYGFVLFQKSMGEQFTNLKVLCRKGQAQLNIDFGTFVDFNGREFPVLFRIDQAAPFSLTFTVWSNSVEGGHIENQVEVKSMINRMINGGHLRVRFDAATYRVETDISLSGFTDAMRPHADECGIVVPRKRAQTKIDPGYSDAETLAGLETAASVLESACHDGNTAACDAVAGVRERISEMRRITPKD